MGRTGFRQRSWSQWALGPPASGGRRDSVAEAVAEPEAEGPPGPPPEAEGPPAP